MEIAKSHRKNYEERLREYEIAIKKWDDLHRDGKRRPLLARPFPRPYKPRRRVFSSEEKITKYMRMRGELNPAKRPEVRAKISEANHRRRLSPESRRKISEAKRGEKHPMWQGGISFVPYGPAFSDELKIQIRKRDGHICAICLKRQGRRKFPVHHIDYNKTNNDPKNLVTVCRRCHGLTVKNKERWIAFFTHRNPTFWARSKQRPLQVVDFITTLGN